jgi:uncharacterized protein YdhG (YjbR/CyaY superfamily)
MQAFADYLAKIADAERRERVVEVLAWVQETFPGLVPRVAWNQPMFTDHGTFIIGFSVAKGHLAVAPERAAIVRFSDEIVQSGYEHSKQLLRIPWDRSVDYALLRRIIAFNIADKTNCTTFWRRETAELQK